MDSNKPSREELKAKLRARMKGIRAKRMTKVQRMDALKEECAKVGLDPNQIIKNMKKNKVVVKNNL